MSNCTCKLDPARYGHSEDCPAWVVDRQPVNRQDEIEARVNAATEGPWKPTRSIGTWIVQGAPGTQYNAEFIAAARDDVPWLLARVRDLEAALREIADYTPGLLGYEGPRDIARAALAPAEAER